MKLKRCIFILMTLVGIFVLPGSVQALDLKLTYNEDWRECRGWKFVIPSYDDNGVIDGHLFVHAEGIVKMDLNNKIVYSKDFDTSNINLESITGDNVEGESDLLITVYDDGDNEVLKKQYGGNGFEQGMTTFYSYDNKENHDGYIVFLTTSSSNLSIEPGYVIIKLNLNGDVVWEKNIDSYLNFAGLFYINNKNIDSFFETGSTKIARVNFSSNENVWEREVGFKIKAANYSYNKNGEMDGVVVVGSNYTNGINIGMIAKYDLNGNEVFRSAYNNANYSSYYFDVISSCLTDGSYDGYMVTGTASYNITFILKYDLNGNLVFEKKYSDSLTFMFRLIDNHDKSGGQNGYLLYGIEVREERKRENVALKGRKCNYLTVAKYTYDMFPVAKEEVDGGTITVKSDAYPGELVKVKVAVKEGYTLARIIVKDENGKEIEVNSDGTFVMPDGKVTVSAIYKRLSNPDTVSAAYMVLGIVLLIAVGSLIVVKQKNKENM